MREEATVSCWSASGPNEWSNWKAGCALAVRGEATTAAATMAAEPVIANSFENCRRDLMAFSSVRGKQLRTLHNRNVATDAPRVGEAVSSARRNDVPDAGRRAIDRDVGLAVAIIVAARHRD